MSTSFAEPTVQEKKASRNTLGIIALVAAILGAIFACIPGALIIGWVLLPIAFILALVSLFLKGKKKAAGISALVISVVGTVIGVVVFFAVVADAFDEAFNEETTASVPSLDSEDVEDEEQNDDAAAEVPADQEEAADEPTGDAEQGSRSNPYPLGTEISSSEWTVTVNSVDLDADAAIAAENPFNDEPAEGRNYILVNLTAQYIGTDDEGAMPWASVEYVSAQGNTFDSLDALAVTPEAFDQTTTLYEGASETGNIALQVPSEDISEGVLAVSPDMFSDTVFVSVD